MLFCSMSQLEAVQDQRVAIELRLDLFPSIDLSAVGRFVRESDCPVLLTLRKASQGGKFEGDEAKQEALIEELCHLSPSFCDLEHDLRPEFLASLFTKYPKTKFILSYHDMRGVPADLGGIYATLAKYPAFSYKIAGVVHSANDALKMLLFARSLPKMSAICMGEKGAFARVLGPILGNLANYGSLRENTGPGQLSTSELFGIYHYASLNEQTAIYGLIGDPIAHSVGHIYHNGVFQKRGINAVYVKMSVKAEELEEFIPFAKEIGIKGLSVTSPLKTSILRYVDQVDPSVEKIGAINTLRFVEGEIIGTNTDGLGALDALEGSQCVRGKKLVLLGAGGAARAIAFEARKRGADVLVLNRTVERARQVAQDIGCEAGRLDQVPSDYDVLIHCSLASMPIDPKYIRPKTTVMDITYFPRVTPFLKEAALKECQIVYGEEMFLHQAARQTAFWLEPLLASMNHRDRHHRGGSNSCRD